MNKELQDKIDALAYALQNIESIESINIEFKKTIFESNDIQALIKHLIKDEHKNTLY